MQIIHAISVSVHLLVALWMTLLVNNWNDRYEQQTALPLTKAALIQTIKHSLYFVSFGYVPLSDGEEAYLVNSLGHLNLWRTELLFIEQLVDDMLMSATPIFIAQQTSPGSA